MLQCVTITKKFGFSLLQVVIYNITFLKTRKSIPWTVSRDELEKRSKKSELRIEKLPTFTCTSLNCKDDQCAICLAEFVKGDQVSVESDLTPDEVVQLPRCEHVFHFDCLKPWLREKNTCPKCRTPIEPEEENETLQDQ